MFDLIFFFFSISKREGAWRNLAAISAELPGSHPSCVNPEGWTSG